MKVPFIGKQLRDGNLRLESYSSSIKHQNESILNSSTA